LPSNITLSVDDFYHGLSELHHSWLVNLDEISGELNFPIKNCYHNYLLSILKFISVTPILKSGNSTVVSNSSSSRAYSGLFKTTAASNTLFHFFLSNATSISSTGLISFRVFLTVSYHFCLGLPLGLFPVKLFSVIFLMSDPSVRQNVSRPFQPFSD